MRKGADRGGRWRDFGEGAAVVWEEVWGALQLGKSEEGPRWLVFRVQMLCSCPLASAVWGWGAFTMCSHGATSAVALQGSVPSALPLPS